MRILFIVAAFPPQKNAVGEYMQCLGSKLLQHNHEIFILTSEFTSIQNDANIEVIKDINLKSLYLKKKIYIIPVIKNWSKELKTSINKLASFYLPDVISLQYEPYSFHRKGLPWFLTSAFVNLKNIPFSVTFHETFSRNYLWEKRFYYLYSIVQKNIITDLHKKSILSFTSIEFYKSQFRDRIEILNIGSNILNNNYFETSTYDLPKNTVFNLLGFGVRDYKIILEALHLLKKKNKLNFIFHIVGDLSEKMINELKYYIQQFDIDTNVIIYGFLNDESFANLLSKMHLYIDAHYSDTRNRGGTTLKSGSLSAIYKAGIPILGFKGDMTDSCLVHSENIWFSDKSEPYLISGSIEFLYLNQKYLYQLHKASIIFFKEQLDWDIIAIKYINKLNQNISK